LGPSCLVKAAAFALAVDCVDVAVSGAVADVGVPREVGGDNNGEIVVVDWATGTVAEEESNEATELPLGEAVIFVVDETDEPPLVIVNWGLALPESPKTSVCSGLH
jgi:hypothetical protein